MECNRCGEPLYYSGGCNGEWEHVNGSCDCSPQKIKAREREAKQEEITAAALKVLRGVNLLDDEMKARLKAALS